MAGTTFLRSMLTTKEQREVSKIYKKYGFTAINFNLAANHAINSENGSRHFDAAVENMSRETLERFWCAWNVYQRSWCKNANDCVECGKEIMPYILKIKNQKKNDVRKAQLNASIEGLIDLDGLKERYSKFYIDVDRRSNHRRHNKIDASAATTYVINMTPYKLDENGNPINSGHYYGNDRESFGRIFFYSDDNGFFNPEEIDAKIKQQTKADNDTYLKRIKEYVKNMKDLKKFQEKLDKFYLG